MTEHKYFGLVEATVDRQAKRIRLQYRKQGPGGIIQDMEAQGRERCLSWALSGLKLLTDDGFIIEG